MTVMHDKNALGCTTLASNILNKNQSEQHGAHGHQVARTDHTEHPRANLESVSSARTIFFLIFSVTRQEIIKFTGNGNGLLFHMTQPISRSTIKAIACSKPTISEH